MAFNIASSTVYNWFYLDTNSQSGYGNTTQKSRYAWLYDYTKQCISHGCIVEDDNGRGYWTSDKIANTSEFIWVVTCDGYMTRSGTNDSAMGQGIRPVITVSKSKF